MKSLQKSKKYSWRNHWGFLPGNSEIRKSMIQEKLPGEINGVSSQVSSQHFPYDFDTRTNQWYGDFWRFLPLKTIFLMHFLSKILTSQNWCPFGHMTFSSCFLKRSPLGTPSRALNET